METFYRRALGWLSDCPHSLGTLIEWKQTTNSTLVQLSHKGPHSLGTLIEWKLPEVFFIPIIEYCPHSLGTLIEWKRDFGCRSCGSRPGYVVPTRWGH